MEETAGYPLYLYAHYLPPASEFYNVANAPIFHNSCGLMYNENVGQHVIFNNMLMYAKECNYDYLLRLDDDCKFVTKDWLKMMVEAAEKLGDNFIISPTIQGLTYPPERSEPVEYNGVKIKVLYSAIGGICRLHNVNDLVKNNYISDVRCPLGSGDATGIGKWAIANNRYMVYLEKVKVKHNTKKQIEADPEYHKWHDLYQHVPYIPVNIGEVNGVS